MSSTCSPGCAIDGLQIPEDLVNEPELGVGLVFPQPKGDTPLDLWLADPKNGRDLDTQLTSSPGSPTSSITPTATGWCTAA